MKFSMILAMDNNNLIGNKNELPWKLPNDLEHFKSITTGKPVVMGRKTFESIGRPLPNRTNIVITRDPDYKKEGIIVLQSIDLLIEMFKDSKEEVIIIGGAELIKQLYDYIDTLYITHIKHNFEGDCYVKFIDFKKLNILSKVNNYPDDKNPYFYSFVTYTKKI